MADRVLPTAPADTLDTGTPFRIPGLDLVNPTDDTSDAEYSPPQVIKSLFDTAEGTVEEANFASDGELNPTKQRGITEKHASLLSKEDIFSDLVRSLNDSAQGRGLANSPAPASPVIQDCTEAESSSSEESEVLLTTETAHRTPSAFARVPTETVASSLKHRAQGPISITPIAQCQQNKSISCGFKNTQLAGNVEQPPTTNPALVNPAAPNTDRALFGGAPAYPASVYGYNMWAATNYRQPQAAPSNYLAKQPHHGPSQFGPQQTVGKGNVNTSYNFGRPHSSTTQSRYNLRSSRGKTSQPRGDLGRDWRGPHLARPISPEKDALVGSTTSQKRHESPLRDVLPRPVPTPVYNRQSRKPWTQLKIPHRLLVIMDLNGTLIFRPNIRRSARAFVPRPDLNQFLDYLFGNHSVMVWSSAQPDNVSAMCKEIFTREQYNKLVACWARNTLRLIPHHYNMRVQVYKQLSWVWDDEQIYDKNCRTGELHPWDQSNTVLLDDSRIKAAAEPFNLVKLPEFEGDEGDKRILSQVIMYLEEAKYASDVSAFIRQKPFNTVKQW